MKSILIIDTPTRCYDCPLYTSIGDEDGSADEYGFCDDRNILKQKEAQEKIRFDAKPKWCPLKPLPKKKIVLEHRIDGYTVNGVEMTEAHGWNACLDAITGETE